MSGAQAAAPSRPWPPGVSGNPAGRPRGALNKRRPTLAELLDAVAATEAGNIIRALVEATRGGDPAAAAALLVAIRAGAGEARP